MKVIHEINYFYELEETCWGGANTTLRTIREYDKEDELMELLEEITEGEPHFTETKLNDLLWFDEDYIFEALGIAEEE